MRYKPEMLTSENQRWAALERERDQLKLKVNNLEAKLGMISEVMARWHDSEKRLGEIKRAIDFVLTNTNKPLAVVEGSIDWDGEASHQVACINARLPGKSWSDYRYKLVVLPKKCGE